MLKKWWQERRSKNKSNQQAKLEREAERLRVLDTCKQYVLNTLSTNDVQCQSCGWKGTFGRLEVRATVTTGYMEEVVIPVYSIKGGDTHYLIIHWCDVRCPICDHKFPEIERSR